MIRNGYYIASDACGRDKNGKFVCVCGKCRVMTKADLVRAMSDEKLAEFMCHNVSNGMVNCTFCAASEFCRMGHNGWIDWLKQEAEEGET